VRVGVGELELLVVDSPFGFDGVGVFRWLEADSMLRALVDFVGEFRELVEQRSVEEVVEVGGAGVGCAGVEDAGGSPLLLERSCL
jgi:hypothetical protein